MLSRASVCVDISVLIAKLKIYGIKRLALNWLLSYLINRKQKAIINANAESGDLNVTLGVPQGSVLGPSLFVIYSNDPPEAINCARVIQYADDTSIVISNKDKLLLKNIWNEKVAQLNGWFCANGRKLNSGKTQIINFPLNNIRSRQSDSSRIDFFQFSHGST